LEILKDSRKIYYRPMQYQYVFVLSNPANVLTAIHLTVSEW